MQSIGELELISTSEAAKQLNITPGRVRQICRGHRTPRAFGKKIGRDWFLTQHDLRRIAEEVLRNPEKLSESA